MSSLLLAPKSIQCRHSYTAAEKVKIADYAEAHGNRKAGREFGVGKSSVCQWRRQKERLIVLPSTKKAERKGKPSYPELDKEVFDFVAERRDAGIPVSMVEMRLMALKATKANPSLVNRAQFTASAGWCHRFVARWHLSVRRCTTLAQKLPADHEDKLLSFQRHILKLRKEFTYPLSAIGNADQTPLTLDLPLASTVDFKGNKSVLTRTTGNEKNRFTVMLACLADGTKLPPYVIFKRKTMPKLKFPPGIIVRVQAKGWMDEQLTSDWLRTVWGSRGFLRRRMLVLDSFQAHRTPAIKAQLREMQTDLVIIPGGMTSQLQPLDVSVNRPFKVLLTKKWNEWMMGREHTFTATVRQRRVQMDTICKWILAAWEELDPQIIVNGFKKCCISNAMDGTEDDLLWETAAEPAELQMASIF